MGVDSVSQIERIKKLSTEFWKQLNTKERIICQKSRSKWLREGDSNSHFFHACVNSNRRKNQITGLRVGDEWVDEGPEVKNLVKSHFESNYS